MEGERAGHGLNRAAHAPPDTRSRALTMGGIVNHGPFATRWACLFYDSIQTAPSGLVDLPTPRHATGRKQPGSGPAGSDGDFGKTARLQDQGSRQDICRNDE